MKSLAVWFGLAYVYLSCMMEGRLSSLGLIIEGASNDLKFEVCSKVLLDHLSIGVDNKIYLGLSLSLLMV